MKNGSQDFLILAILALELWLIHAAVGFQFGPNNSRLGFYARDIVAPLFLGMFLYLRYLRRETRLPLELQPGILATNLFLLATTIAFIVGHDEVRKNLSAETAVSLLFALVFGTLGTSGFVLLRPGKMIAAVRSQKGRLGYAVAGLGSLVLYARVVDFFQKEVGLLTGAGVCKFLGLFGTHVKFLVLPPFFQLSHPDLLAQFATGCSGTEGIFFFLFLFGLQRSFEKDRRTGPIREVPFVAAGIVYMYLLNVLRLAFFFLIGIYLAQHYPHGTARNFFSFSAHANLGWILFFPAIPLFFLVREKLIKG